MIGERVRDYAAKNGPVPLRAIFFRTIRVFNAYAANQYH
jgi:hypothetical protein